MYILIADTHRLRRDIVKMVIDVSSQDIDNSAFVVPLHFLEAGSFDEALLYASEAAGLDLIVMHRSIPGMNGLKGLRIISACFPDVPVVVMSDSLETADALGALERGVHGYIDMSVGINVLSCALQLVMSGERYIPPAILSALRLDEYDEEDDSVRPHQGRTTQSEPGPADAT